MKKQNIFASIAIIVAAIAIGIWLGHRSVTVPVMPAPDSSSTIGSADTSTGGSADDGSADTGDKTYTLACDSGKSVTLTFHLPGDATIDVMTDDGRDLTLDNTSTSSAASYSSPDGKIVLSLSGSTLALTENGTATYQNCALMPVAGTGADGSLQ